jgi:hypothetical protein
VTEEKFYGNRTQTGAQSKKKVTKITRQRKSDEKWAMTAKPQPTGGYIFSAVLFCFSIFLV